MKLYTDFGADHEKTYTEALISARRDTCKVSIRLQQSKLSIIIHFWMSFKKISEFAKSNKKEKQAVRENHRQQTRLNTLQGETKRSAGFMENKSVRESPRASHNCHSDGSHRRWSTSVMSVMTSTISGWRTCNWCVQGESALAMINWHTATFWYQTDRRQRERPRLTNAISSPPLSQVFRALVFVCSVRVSNEIFLLETSRLVLMNWWETSSIAE